MVVRLSFGCEMKISSFFVNWLNFHFKQTIFVYGPIQVIQYEIHMKSCLVTITCATTNREQKTANDRTSDDNKIKTLNLPAEKPFNLHNYHIDQMIVCWDVFFLVVVVVVDDSGASGTSCIVIVVRFHRTQNTLWRFADLAEILRMRDYLFTFCCFFLFWFARSFGMEIWTVKTTTIIMTKSTRRADDCDDYMWTSANVC